MFQKTSSRKKKNTNSLSDKYCLQIIYLMWDLDTEHTAKNHCNSAIKKTNNSMKKMGKRVK